MEIIKESAKYAPTAEKELERSLKLLSGEKIQKKMRSVVYTNRLFVSPGFIILTNKRIIFLMHHVFSPDKMFYLPLELISKVNFKILGFSRAKAQAIEIKYSKGKITFAISLGQRMVSSIAWSISDPEETAKFLNLLKNKLGKKIVDETEVKLRNFDYYLCLIGALIGGFIINGLLPSLILGIIGYLIGKIFNRLFK